MTEREILGEIDRLLNKMVTTLNGSLGPIEASEYVVRRLRLDELFAELKSAPDWKAHSTSGRSQ